MRQGVPALAEGGTACVEKNGFQLAQALQAGFVVFQAASPGYAQERAAAAAARDSQYLSYGVKLFCCRKSSFRKRAVSSVILSASASESCALPFMKRQNVLGAC